MDLRAGRERSQQQSEHPQGKIALGHRKKPPSAGRSMLSASPATKFTPRETAVFRRGLSYGQVSPSAFEHV
jgi:hypothetical protein